MGEFLARPILAQLSHGAEIFTGTGRAILGQVGSCFEDQIGIGNQVAKGLQRTSVEWHAFSVKRVAAGCKRSLF